MLIPRRGFTWGLHAAHVWTSCASYGSYDISRQDLQFGRIKLCVVRHVDHVGDKHDDSRARGISLNQLKFAVQSIGHRRHIDALHPLSCFRHAYPKLRHPISFLRLVGLVLGSRLGLTS